MSDDKNRGPDVVTMTQKDYEERLARRTAGHQSDEDLRLIKLYEAEGYTPNGRTEDESERRPASRSESAAGKDDASKDDAKGSVPSAGNSTATSSASTSAKPSESAKSDRPSVPSTRGR